MVDSLIECIPNFSEARNPHIINEIRSAILHVNGIAIIDQHSDIDHNRTVITMLGSPTAIEEAAFQGVAKAVELIDLNHHEGQHPRIGAADVIPFIPIHNASMVDCVEIARRLARRIGNELQIPVYLYEEAATREDRKRLENIRRGQYEGLRDEILSNPARLPDFGPAHLGPAGATAVGARNPLIAFNVYLNSPDIEIAKKISTVVRHSSGGLRNVKALGLLVNGLAQVSMNLTDYKQSALHHVVEMVRREAIRYGVSIHHTELVGLIPQKALVDSAQWYLQLDQFSTSQILESRIASALTGSIQTTDRQNDTFLENLSSSSEFPGEKAAIAHTAATALALIAMTARRATEQSTSDETRARMISLIERVESHRVELDIAENAISFDSQFSQSFNDTTFSSDPEQAAAKREQKEHMLQIRIAHLVTFANQCLGVVNLALVIAENCEHTERHTLLTASKLASTTFDCVAEIIKTDCGQSNDDQFIKTQQKQIDEMVLYGNQTMNRLTDTISINK